MSQEGFWDDSDAANKTMQQMKALKGVVEPFDKTYSRVNDALELMALAEGDEAMTQQLHDEVAAIEAIVEQLEIQATLSGEFDDNNAIVSINAGAGGTESCDWASMLLRMYLRWTELKDFKYEIIDTLYADEAGIKSTTFRVEGPKAYGLLKSEKGVHRLVRISPFDSNKRRHTSFVSVDVIPEIDDDVDIDISPDDLRIDIFRASGPGGQSVNTTDSAVRITHTPSGIVVQCQNERSQLQNKEQAMRVLRARLYEMERAKQEEKMATEYGQKQKIEWGSQIRSYVMHPYNMVKDHRTDAETGNVPRVMDGDIDMFIEAYLKKK